MIVTSNLRLKEASDNFISIFSTTSFPYVVRLFQNNIAVEPDTAIEDFSEADFDTYEAKSLASTWGPSTKVIEGQYQTATAEILWEVPSSGSQTIYGWYVTGPGGTTWYFGETFADPFVIEEDGDPLVLQLLYNFWARAILP